MNAYHASHTPGIEELKSRYTVADAWRDEGFPGTPGRSCRSPFREEHNASFSVFDDARRWKDHAAGEGGDVIDFIVKAQGCSIPAAIAIVRERVGWKPGQQGPTSSRRAEPRRIPTPQSRFNPQPMAGDVRLAWEAGVHWLRTDFETQREVDQWRAWPTGTSAILADHGIFSAPEWKGRRGLAWLVQYPGRTSWIDVGFHFRHKPHRRGERAIWTYQPAGIGLPGVPLVLGNFYGARLVVVCEGEWDAVTFAATAGWLATDTSWPDGIAVLGVRGATGWRSFLEHWRRVWPRRPRFLLIPDNDEAGRKWHQEFAGALAPLAISVTLLPPKSDGPKDFNDLHRAQGFSSSDIHALLLNCGLIDKRGTLL